MLNLNQQATNEPTTIGSYANTSPSLPSSSVPILGPEGDPIWKVLVFDNLGRDVISSVLRVSDLRNWGITIHLSVIGCFNEMCKLLQANDEFTGISIRPDIQFLMCPSSTSWNQPPPICRSSPPISCAVYIVPLTLTSYRVSLDHCWKNSHPKQPLLVRPRVLPRFSINTSISS